MRGTLGGRRRARARIAHRGDARASGREVSCIRSSARGTRSGSRSELWWGAPTTGSSSRRGRSTGFIHGVEAGLSISEIAARLRKLSDEPVAHALRSPRRARRAPRGPPRQARPRHRGPRGRSATAAWSVRASLDRARPRGEKRGGPRHRERGRAHGGWKASAREDLVPSLDRRLGRGASRSPTTARGSTGRESQRRRKRRGSP